MFPLSWCNYSNLLSDSHHNNRSESFSCSTSNRKISMPKSPDSKLASPRLCLKFHRDHLGSHANPKSRDSTYSVTNVSVSESLDNPMFSPVDSPASSVEEDLYNPHLDHVTNFSGSRVKITIPEDDNSIDFQLKQNSNNLPVDGERTGNSLTKEVFPDQGTCDSERTNTSVTFPSFMCTSSDNQVNKSVLKSSETLPFKPNSQFSFTQNDEDSLEELPDLEIDTSDTIPSKEVNNSSHANAANSPDCNSVSSSDINEASKVLPSQSNVSSSTESTNRTSPSQVMANETEDDVIQASSKSVTSENVTQINSVSESVSNTESQNNVTNTSEALSSTSVTCTNSKTESCSTGSPKEDVDSVRSDSVKPCSPTRADRDSKDSRSSSPKVPPLKIIIPPKSQPSSTASDNNEGLKLVVTNVKSALPYVINPYQDQGSEAEALVQNSSDHWPVNHIQGHTSQSVSQFHGHMSNSVDLNFNSSFSDSEKVKKSGSVKGDSSSENVDMEIDEINAPDSGVVKETQDGDKFSEHGEDSGSNSSKCDMDGKREDRKEEPTQRVLRSAVRSQQQSSTDTKIPKQQKVAEKSDKTEKSDRNSKYP